MTEASADVAVPQLSTRSELVAVLAPSGRDAQLAVDILDRWRIRAASFCTMAELCAAIEEGVGVVVLAEEALHGDARPMLESVLQNQPPWSDVPVAVITAAGELSRVMATSVEALTRRGNVTLLERPIRVATLVTAIRSALRARERQYDVRDYLVVLAESREEAEAARAEADAANRAKSEFLAVMSHELRTPLNAIGGYAELIELEVHGPVTDEQRDALRRVQKSQRHLLGLINGVLNYARIETGNVNYDIDVVPVDEVLATCEALIAPQVRARGLRLVLSGCTQGTHVVADREKVQQIVLNLLSNAVKFTDPGGSIGVSCLVTAGTVEIRVTDSGRGIPPEKIDAIFEPFVQVDVRLTRTQEGIGLGLAISRDLARGMGGDLSVESRLGEGSVFTLALPLAPNR